MIIFQHFDTGPTIRNRVHIAPTHIVVIRKIKIGNRRSIITEVQFHSALIIRQITIRSNLNTIQYIVDLLEQNHISGSFTTLFLVHYGDIIIVFYILQQDLCSIEIAQGVTYHLLFQCILCSLVKFQNFAFSHTSAFTFGLHQFQRNISFELMHIIHIAFHGTVIRIGFQETNQRFSMR